MLLPSGATDHHPGNINRFLKLMTESTDSLCSNDHIVNDYTVYYVPLFIAFYIGTTGGPVY